MHWIDVLMTVIGAGGFGLLIWGLWHIGQAVRGVPEGNCQVCGTRLIESPDTQQRECEGLRPAAAMLSQMEWIEKYGGQALLDREGFTVVPCTDCDDTICHGWRVVKRG